MAYGTTADLAVYGAPAAAFTGIDDPTKQAALDAASDMADGYLRARYTVPRTSYGKDLTIAVCKIATYDLLVRRGFNPQAGADVNFRLRNEDAIAWLKSVSRGEVHLAGAPVETADFDQPRVVSNTKRGW